MKPFKNLGMMFSYQKLFYIIFIIIDYDENYFLMQTFFFFFQIQVW